MNINALYNRLIKDPESRYIREKELFNQLTVSFRIFAQQRIWNSQDSEEIVQDALMTIASKYRDIEFETSFAAWAYRVLNFKIADYFKARKIRENARYRLTKEARESVLLDLDPILKSRLLECLRKIGEVNSVHARVLNLHYQGYTTNEICDRLDINRGNLYVMLSRARVMLDKCLDKGDIK